MSRNDCHVLSTTVDKPGMVLVPVSRRVLPARRFSTIDKPSPIAPLLAFESPLSRWSILPHPSPHLAFITETIQAIDATAYMALTFLIGAFAAVVLWILTEPTAY